MPCKEIEASITMAMIMTGMPTTMETRVPMIGVTTASLIGVKIREPKSGKVP